MAKIYCTKCEKDVEIYSDNVGTSFDFDDDNGDISVEVNVFCSECYTFYGEYSLTVGLSDLS